MIKAVIFDLDHTLYSREETMQKLAPDLLRFLGIERDAGLFSRELIHADYYLYDENYLFQGPAGIFRELCKTAPLPDFDRYLEFVNHHMGRYATCYPFTEQVLSDCRELGFRLGMITNGKRSLQDQKLASLGVAKWFDDIMTAGDKGLLKPDPRVFELEAERLGIAAQSCVFVGDNPLDDISGAKNAGMTAVWVRQERGFPADLPRPDAVVESIEELPGLLREWIAG